MIIVLLEICNEYNPKLNTVLFHDDLLSKLIEYLDSTHAAFLIRIDRSYRSNLDRDQLNRMIQEKKAAEDTERDYMVSAGGIDSNDIRVYDRNGQCLKVLSGHTCIVHSAVYNQDGSLIASAGGDSTVRIWNAYDGACLKVLKNHDLYVYTVAFNQAGTQIVSASYDKTVRVFDVYTGECLKVLEGHTKLVKSAVFNHDGSRIVSASFDRTVRIWDVQSGLCLMVLENHNHFVNSAVFNHDGSRILTASGVAIRIYDAATGVCLRKFEGHAEYVYSAAFNNQGSLVVSASFNKKVRIWDAQTGECLQILEGHSRLVNSAVFNQDDSLIVSSSSDKTIRVWDATSGQCLTVIYASNNSACFKRMTLQPKDSIFDLIEFLERKGNDLFRHKLFEQAILKYLETIAIFKNDSTIAGKTKRSSIYLNIALCYYNLNDYSDSLYYAERALFLNKSNKQAIILTCDNLRHLRRFNDAIKLLNDIMTSGYENKESIEMRNKITELIRNDI